MVSWLCPYCNKRMYSSYGFDQKQLITCINCQLKFINPYFRPRTPAEKQERPST